MGQNAIIKKIANTIQEKIDLIMQPFFCKFESEIPNLL